MDTEHPILSIYCIDNNGEEYDMMFDIDLSHDPLLNKAYTKSWIIHLIEKKYKTIDNIKQFNIIQHNSNNCIYDLPKWYMDLQ